MMNRVLDGKVALVTGGASGIGRAISETLAGAGAAVLLTYATSGAEAEAIVAAIRDAGGKAAAVQADLTREAAAADAVDQAMRRFGALDVAVVNAGGLLKRVRPHECDLAFWDAAIALNLTSVFLTCRAALALMLAAGRGSISAISSLAGHDGGGPGSAHYAAAKAGVIGFTKALAKEYGPQGIRANSIAPGLIATRFHDTFNTPEGRAAGVARTPLRREGQPGDVASAALFLASDAAGFLTGETIEVNGGMAMR